MTEFKKGDKVRALDNYPGSFTKGKEYEVSGSYYGSGDTTRCSVVSDDSGTSNGWRADKFELVTRKNEPPGPVTLETVKRINTGTFKRVHVTPINDDFVSLHLQGQTFSATELRDISELATQLADALEGK